MRGIVFITLVLCFLVSCISRSEALKVHKVTEVEESAPDVEETKKSTEQIEQEEVTKPSEAKEKEEAAAKSKKINVKTIMQEALQRFTEEKPDAKKAEKEKEVKKSSTSAEARRALIEKKRRQLDNTSWEIELIPLGGKGKKQIDIITFKNNQVVSANLFKLGFTSTNYTITVKEDGGMVWETMQTSQKGPIAFWRGEIDINMAKMQGILSHHISDKTTQDYSFSSAVKKAMNSDITTVIEVPIPPEEDVFPMVPPGKGLKDTLWRL